MIHTTSLILTAFLTLVVAQARTPDSQPESAQVNAAAIESQSATAPSVRFATVDIYVDSGDQPLAAYQCELTAEQNGVKIVGIEGGEHAAFRDPPYYDPAALMNRRVILAAFNTGADLPKGKSRVARVHVRIAGDAEPQYELTLIAAGAPDGRRIDVKLSTK